MAEDDVSIRQGSAADLRTTFALSDRTMHTLAMDQGILRGTGERSAEQVQESWARHRSLIEFLDAQERQYLIAENSAGPVAYVRVVRFEGMEELTDLMVEPSHQGKGLGRRLLEQVWPGDPSPAMGRVVIATGEPRDLSLYTEF